MSKEFQYTVVSENEDDYSTIFTCIEAPPAPITKLTNTGLTTLCTIVALHEKDCIDINDEKYYLKESYTNLNSTSLSSLLTDLLQECKITVSVDHSNRIKFRKEYDAHSL